MAKDQRIFVLLALTLILVLLFAFPITRPAVASEISAVLFSSLFLMSFSALLLEHFFGRPTDVLAASVSILFLLVPLRPIFQPWGGWYYAYLVYEVILIVCATTALLLLTDQEGPRSIRNRLSFSLKTAVTKFGSGRVQYFFLAFFTTVFFVEPRTAPFVTLLAYSALVLAVDPQQQIANWPKRTDRKGSEVGEIFGVQGRNTFLVRLHPSFGRPALRFSDLLELRYGMDEPPRLRRGIILERFFLDQAQWIRVLCHDEIDRSSVDLPPLDSHRKDAVYKLEGRDASDYLGALVGVVREGTETTTMRFLQAGRAPAREGDLVEVQTNEGPVLYQIVNARVDVEPLESRNVADLVVGEAVQLGQWSADKGTFERFGWVPAARTPVISARAVDPAPPNPEEIELGCIPGTDFRVLLNRHEAISHHTAILGVTGAGKSVFARSLVRKLLEDDSIRVIVVDFTREWKNRLTDIPQSVMIAADETKPMFEAVDEIATELSKFRNQRNPETIKAARRVLWQGFSGAITRLLTGEEKLGIFELPDVSNTEGVLEYTQWFFRSVFHIAREKQNYGKRVCIVLEEAHTVIPEWNFIGIADKSSQALVNNIGQIALQGRKYGVGFIVIAQRTANVSKTVLTQCNTIIAFQCFDATSIDFLSHYLPAPMANALPNFRFRHAVAVGKAVRGSVPLIFEVPEIQEEIPEDVAPRGVGSAAAAPAADGRSA